MVNVLEYYMKFPKRLFINFSIMKIVENMCGERYNLGKSFFFSFFIAREAEAMQAFKKN